MKAIEKKIFRGIGNAMLLALFGTALLSRCANTMAPQGGPKDTIPPRVTYMNPEFAATGFNTKRIFIEFDEYVKLKDQQKEIFTSPFMEKKPSVTIRGRGVQVDLQSPLDSNTTYAINFGSSVVDNNEENAYNGLRYVFSTGKEIDSLVMSGYTVNALTGDTLPKAFIYFFDAKLDSVPEYDSVIFKNKPEVVGRSFNNGIFIAENLKDKDYRIYAVEDNNGNQTYEPGADRIAFMDTVYNPAKMPPFSVWFDSTRMYLQADPQIYMRLFMDTPFRRQLLSSSERPGQHEVTLNFSAPHPEILSLQFDSIPEEDIIREYKTKTKDTITLWLATAPEHIPDSLNGTIIYMKHDSLSVLHPDTAKLKLFWKRPFVKEKKEKEKERDKEKGKEEKEPNPFKVTVEASANVNPEKHIPMKFDLPLRSLDSARIGLEWIEVVKEQERPPVAVPFSIRQDTADMRRWTLSANWKIDEKYRLLIPAGVFTDIAGHSNDTLRAEFTIDSPDKFSTVILNLVNGTPGYKYILQIVSNNSVVKEIKGVDSGKHTFQYINPGEIKIRVIEDKNGNGEWDAGSLIERRQPERIAYFRTETDDETVTTKLNWELEFDVDASKLFTPVTMESMAADIHRKEEIRLREIAKSRGENQKNQNDNQRR